MTYFPTTRRPSRPAAGFSLIEVVLTVAILSVMAGLTVGVTSTMVNQAKSDSGTVAVVNMLELARNRAVSERREFQVIFTIPNKIEVVRLEVPSGSTPISTRFLESGQEYLKFTGVPDTPDTFATSINAIDFGTTPTIRFTSDGSLLDSSGDVVNGTVFLGNTGQKSTARAVTVFGPTGLIRDWKWNGSGAWQE